MQNRQVPAALDVDDDLEALAGLSADIDAYPAENGWTIEVVLRRSGTEQRLKALQEVPANSWSYHPEIEISYGTDDDVSLFVAFTGVTLEIRTSIEQLHGLVRPIFAEPTSEVYDEECRDLFPENMKLQFAS